MVGQELALIKDILASNINLDIKVSRILAFKLWLHKELVSRIKAVQFLNCIPIYRD